MHHLDSWIKTDQLDVTCFIISPFTVQHVSNVSTSIFRSLWLKVHLLSRVYGFTSWVFWLWNRKVWYVGMNVSEKHTTSIFMTETLVAFGHSIRFLFCVFMGPCIAILCPTGCNYTRFTLSVNCPTCFGWSLHPSTVTQITVSTVSVRYSWSCSWWWVDKPPEICKAVYR